MRGSADQKKIRQVLRALGERAQGPGRIYLVGGTSIVLDGGRPSTVDLDLKLDPEPKGVFEAIAAIKEEFQVNVELAAPDQFIPELPDWRSRSPLVARHGLIDFHHYDFYSQALAKLSRSHERDISDVRHWCDSGKIDCGQLWSYFVQIEHDLVRYPHLDRSSFGDRVRKFVSQ